MYPFKPRSIPTIAVIVMLMVILLDYSTPAQPSYSPGLPNDRNQQVLSSSASSNAVGTQVAGAQTEGVYGRDRSKTHRHKNNRNYRTFGEAGRSGRSGSNGRAGSSRSRLDLRVFAEPTSNSTYDQRGASGEDGTNGNLGEHARSCRVPHRPAYSLVGANGGDGGDGGSGGNGGDGGDVSIYYADPALLKQVAIDASGGQGGRPGQGAAGGDGCECVEPEWVVNFCEWEIWQRRSDIENAEWTLASRETTPCTGVRGVDERDNAPPLPTARGNNLRYQVTYQGVSHTERFRCQDGERGSQGRDGQPGANGSYGEFWLIPQETIPQERAQHSGQLRDLLGQTTALVKNIWVPRQGLREVLHPASDIPDRYTYLQSTERPQYRLEWTADSSPAELDVDTTEVGASIQVSEGRANLEFDLPGTLDYTVTQQDGVDVVTLTGGFSPTRVKSFRVDSTTASEGESQLVLVDDGDLHGLLRKTVIEVTCLTKQSVSGLVTEDYRPRHTVSFDTSALSSSSLNISDNVYTLDLSRQFGVWLKPNYDVAYDVSIQQTTNSGAVYTQAENVTFRVPAEGV